MKTVNQKTAMPTNKLTMAILGAIVFELCANQIPALRDIHIDGIGNLSLAVQILFMGIPGYMIPDFEQ